MEYNAFHLSDPTRLAQAIALLVTLELIDSTGASNDVPRLICLVLNLDNLPVIKYSEWGANPAPRYGTSPGFRYVLILKHVGSCRDFSMSMEGNPLLSQTLLGRIMIHRKVK